MVGLLSVTTQRWRWCEKRHSISIRFFGSIGRFALNWLITPIASNAPFNNRPIASIWLITDSSRRMRLFSCFMKNRLISCSVCVNSFNYRFSIPKWMVRDSIIAARWIIRTNVLDVSQVDDVIRVPNGSRAVIIMQEIENQNLNNVFFHLKQEMPKICIKSRLALHSSALHCPSPQIALKTSFKSTLFNATDFFLSFASFRLWTQKCTRGDRTTMTQPATATSIKVQLTTNNAFIARCMSSPSSSWDRIQTNRPRLQPTNIENRPCRALFRPDRRRKRVERKKNEREQFWNEFHGIMRRHSETISQMESSRAQWICKRLDASRQLV